MIKLKNVYKKLDKFQLDINLDIQKNEYFVILGKTGSGKTILLNLIARFLNADAGEVITGNNKIGMLYQNYLLFPHYTVKENIEYSLKFSTKKENIKEICQLLDISHIIDRYPKNLSGGEKQRTALARAIISKPQIILLDEPFSSLDIVTKNKLITLIKSIHKKENITFIHVTHDLEEAITLANRICVIEQGKILQIGTPFEILKKPISKFVANLVGARNIYYGKIQKNFIQIHHLKIFINTDKTGFVNITISPEDILLSIKKIDSSARNYFSGKIINILLKQYLCEVEVDIGITIIVFITKTSCEKLSLKLGKEVWVTFKTTKVHIF
ncbi:MAG: ABC transporter ATP-binding protein [Bacteroidetes bacterium]|nr:ABC transporter ATP-binding protein [Bacteroidota bacterium]